MQRDVHQLTLHLPAAAQGKVKFAYCDLREETVLRARGPLPTELSQPGTRARQEAHRHPGQAQATAAGQPGAG